MSWVTSLRLSRLSSCDFRHVTKDPTRTRPTWQSLRTSHSGWHSHEVPQRIHPCLCYRCPSKSRAGCTRDFEASTPCDLARAWSVCSVPRHADMNHEPTPTGDSYDSSGILKIKSHVEEMHPGIFIHSVYIDPDSKEDQRATYVRSGLGLLPVAVPTAVLCLHKITNSTEMSTTKWNSSQSSFNTCPSYRRASMQSGSPKVRTKRKGPS
jgi:hypothetical protein